MKYELFLLVVKLMQQIKSIMTDKNILTEIQSSNYFFVKPVFKKVKIVQMKLLFCTFTNCEQILIVGTINKIQLFVCMNFLI